MLLHLLKVDDLEAPRAIMVLVVCLLHNLDVNFLLVLPLSIELAVVCLLLVLEPPPPAPPVPEPSSTHNTVDMAGNTHLLCGTFQSLQVANRCLQNV